MVGHLAALVLIVALSLLGTPLPAHAAGEELPVPRGLTIQGQPLSDVVSTFGISRTGLPTLAERGLLPPLHPPPGLRYNALARP